MQAPLSKTSADQLPYTFKEDRFASHAQIAGLIIKRAEASGNKSHVVLDIGCAYGFLRPYLARPRFYLIGTDINEEAVNRTRERYDEAYLTNIATQVDLQLTRPPDTIVMGDILEHLPDPLAVLRRIVERYGRPGTQYIISLPNVAHLYVRYNLLLGRFNYAERGILDRTHLRFFTKKSATDLVMASGLRALSIHATPIPLPLIHASFAEGRPLFFVHSLSYQLARIFKPLLAYQFIFEACHE
jgi:SAM-dependent methyltransferase